MSDDKPSDEALDPQIINRILRKLQAWIAVGEEPEILGSHVADAIERHSELLAAERELIHWKLRSQNNYEYATQLRDQLTAERAKWEARVRELEAAIRWIEEKAGSSDLVNAPRWALRECGKRARATLARLGEEPKVEGADSADEITDADRLNEAVDPRQWLCKRCRHGTFEVVLRETESAEE